MGITNLRISAGWHNNPPFLPGVNVRLLSCGAGSEKGDAGDDDDGEIKAAVNSCSHGENSF
jgi:hypothetical protein